MNVDQCHCQNYIKKELKYVGKNKYTLSTSAAYVRNLNLVRMLFMAEY